MAAHQLHMELASPLCSVGLFDDVIIIAVHVELTVEALHASVAANRRFVAQGKRGVASLALAHFGARIPNAQIRAAAGQAMAETRLHTLCAAQVIAGEGFWHSAVRSVITAMEQLRPDDRPRKTFRSVQDAGAWLAERLQRDSAWVAALGQAAQALLETQRAQDTRADEVSPRR